MFTRRQLVTGASAFLGVTAAGQEVLPELSPIDAALMRGPQSPLLEEKLLTFADRVVKRGPRAGRPSLLPNERVGILVYDYTTRRILANIRGEEQFQLASMVKPIVAWDYFDHVGARLMRHTPENQERLYKAIHFSRNHEAGEFFDILGGFEAIDARLKANYSHIFSKLDIKEKIPDDGRTYKNKAALTDLLRFMDMVWRTPDEQPHRELKRLMMQEYSWNRSTQGVKEIPDGTLDVSKTGTTGEFCGTMSVTAPIDDYCTQYPYAVIIGIERPNNIGNKLYAQWKEARYETCRAFCGIIYSHIQKEIHPLPTLARAGFINEISFS